jgi:hypothetical protein
LKKSRTLTLLSIALALLLSTACTQVVSNGSSLKPIDETNTAEESIASVEDETYDGGTSASDEAYDVSEPANILLRFQNANNNRDLQALMDCYDPEYLDASQALGEGVGGALSEILFGFSLDVDTKKLMPFFSKAFQKYVQSDDVYATIELTEISTSYSDEDNATVRYVEKLIAQDGTVQSESEQEFPVTRVDGIWYISMTDVLLSALQNIQP